MKILICGNTDVWAIENFYCKHLNSLGFNTSIFPSGNIFRGNYNLLYKKIRHKFLPFILYNKINEELIQKVRIENPDVVFVFKGMELYPSTIEKIRQYGIKTINYNTDHPFIFASKGAGNNNVRKSIKHYDLHLSYSLRIIDDLKKTYGVNCEFLAFGYDHGNKNFGYFPNKEIKKIAFVGNPDEYRASILNRLADDVPMDIFGHNWGKYKKNKNITLKNPTYDQDFWYTLQNYRAQINIFRPHNFDSHNMRSIEVPSVGGIMIAPESIEHNFLFENEKEAFFYRDFNQLKEICLKILKMPNDDVLTIRKSAYEKCINSKYSYLHRSKQVTEYLETLMFRDAKK